MNDDTTAQSQIDERLVPKRRCIVILGPHRSGTSTLAGALYHAGIPMGAPLWPATEDNPRGFFEHVGLVECGESLLHRYSSSWDDPSPGFCWPTQDLHKIADSLVKVYQNVASDLPLFAIKEPRMTRFLDAWQIAFTAMRVEPIWLWITRNPEAVASSLHKRNGLPRAQGLLLWTLDNARIARFLAGKPHTMVSYERLLDEPERLLQTIIRDLPPLCQKNIDVKAGAESVDPDLNHSRSTVKAQSDKEQFKNLPQSVTIFWNDICNSCSAPERQWRIENNLVTNAEFIWNEELFRYFYQCRDSDAAAPSITQLFPASDTSGIEESTSIRMTTPVKGKLTSICINLPAGTTTLRFDPVSVPASFRIVSVSLKGENAHQDEIIIDSGSRYRGLYLQSLGAAIQCDDSWLVISPVHDCQIIISHPLLTLGAIRQVAITMAVETRHPGLIDVLWRWAQAQNSNEIICPAVPLEANIETAIALKQTNETLRTEMAALRQDAAWTESVLKKLHSLDANYTVAQINHETQLQQLIEQVQNKDATLAAAHTGHETQIQQLLEQIQNKDAALAVAHTGHETQIQQLLEQIQNKDAALAVAHTGHETQIQQLLEQIRNKDAALAVAHTGHETQIQQLLEQIHIKNDIHERDKLHYSCELTAANSHCRRIEVESTHLRNERDGLLAEVCHGQSLLDVAMQNSSSFKYRGLISAQRLRMQSTPALPKMQVDLSIIIPTFNAGNLFSEVLEGFARQEFTGTYEIRIIDSGSIDNTLLLAERYGAFIEHIPQSDFNHGTTRTRAASSAKGTVLLFTVQDATPADKTLVQAVYDSFSDLTIAALYARQIPRPDADPITKRNITNWLAGGLQSRIQEISSQSAFDAAPPFERFSLAVFDNVCSAIRADEFVKRPFQKHGFGEDIAWGLDTIKSGGRILYQPRAAVIHSHNRSIWYEFKRTYICHKKLIELFGLRTIPTRANLRASLWIGAKTDFLHALKSEESRLIAPFSALRAACLSLFCSYAQYRASSDADSNKSMNLKGV